jgi:glycogen(starch) synthase
LLVLGRLIRDKGVDLAISAFAAIADRFPELRMVIGGDGPERTSLEVHAASMGVADRIEFLGWGSPEEVPALLNSATIVVMPSHREGLPSVALEAALMARPVVATQVGGVPEVVADRKTGLLVPPGNELALTLALRHLLDRPDTAARLGEAARARAQLIFGFTKYVDTYEALYYRLTAGDR